MNKTTRRCILMLLWLVIFTSTFYTLYSNWQHPELTTMQMLQGYWPWYSIGILAALIWIYVYEKDIK